MIATHVPARLSRLGLGLIVLSVLTPSLRAGEAVQWRTDYNEARKEATAKGRPLFLDFGTEECFHCKRMDASTFQNAEVVELLNRNFVPLKVDGNLEPTLVNALRIQVYPTMIVAATDGKILSMIEGYMEAGRLREHLHRAIMTGTPDWMARDFQEANKSINRGEYARAVSLLKAVVEDGKGRPVQVKAQQVLDDIEQQAAGRLARARDMETRGQTLEATDVLADLLSRYAGTQAAKDGATLLTSLADKPEIRDRQRSRRARELLAQAREDFKASRYLSCLDHCEILAGTFSDLPEGIEGAQLAAQIQSDPQRMDEVVRGMNTRLAQMYVVQAEAWVKKGETAQAKLCLERAVKTCPDSECARTAQTRLAQLDSPSGTRTVGGEKQ